MKKIYKVAVVGGTGKSGKYLVQELLNQGIHFKLLVRNPEKPNLQHSLIEIVYGNVKDYSSVLSLAEGCQAIISMLGLGQPPSEPNIFSLSTKNVIDAMRVLGIQRYIVITGLNVDAPFDNKGTITQAGTKWMYENFPVSTGDKQKEYDILSASGLKWTMVRLPLIELTDIRSEVRVSTEDCPGTKINAINLADFLINQLMDKRYVGKAPFLANA